MWPEAKNNALIHDSFNCDKNNGGVPFPTQRLGDCYVAIMSMCNNNTSSKSLVCPSICRPKDHQDWITC